LSPRHQKPGTGQQAGDGNQSRTRRAQQQEGTVKDNGTSLFLAKVVSWLRAGYPDGVPEHDCVRLIALLGSQLTDDEVTLVAGEPQTGASPLRPAVRYL
jgi:hypothetical protein